MLAADVYQYSYVNVNTYIKYGYGDEYEGWGFESPSGRDIFCLKIFDTFPRTPVRVLKINAVAHAQLTFQMLILLQNIYTTRASIQQHGTANVWPW